jgi:oxalate decarboxylase/phosphoglucose isomerase-like protein (cupin superfamily)
MESEATPSRRVLPRYVVTASEQPIVDQSDPNAEAWMAAGGDPRDRGRMVELISRELTGAENFMLGLAWFDPGDVHLLHHHPHADEWYYVIGGSAVFTVGTEQVRGTTGTAIFIPAGTGHRIHNDGAETLHIAWGFNRPDLTEVGIVWDE